MVLFGIMVVVAIVGPPVDRWRYRRKFAGIARGLGLQPPRGGGWPVTSAVSIDGRGFEMRHDVRGGGRGSSYRGPRGHLLIAATRLAGTRWPMHQVDISRLEGLLSRLDREQAAHRRPVLRRPLLRPGGRRAGTGQVARCRHAPGDRALLRRDDVRPGSSGFATASCSSSCRSRGRASMARPCGRCSSGRPSSRPSSIARRARRQPTRPAHRTGRRARRGTDAAACRNRARPAVIHQRTPAESPHGRLPGDAPCAQPASRRPRPCSSERPPPAAPPPSSRGSGARARARPRLRHRHRSRQETPMDQPTIVNRDEWIAARAALLVKEKAAHACAGRPRRRAPPPAHGEGGHALRVRHAGRAAHARRALRRAIPARRVPLHAGTRLGGRLPELLAARGPHRWQRRAPRASRRHAGGRVARAAARDRAPSSSAWAGDSPGSRRSAAASIRTTMCPSRRTRSRAAACTTTSTSPGSRARKRRASASSTRTRPAACYHTYSTYARGGERFIGAYQYLDVVPKGRDEEGLAFSMGWVRHHDRYGDGYAVDAAQAYQPPAIVGECCAAHDTADHRNRAAVTIRGLAIRSWS